MQWNILKKKLDMNSYIYVGQVRHRRFLPKRREFRYSLFMMYLDLAELPEIFNGRLFWSAQKPSLAWFRREDHFGDVNISLDEQVRRIVEERTGVRPKGAIRLLTHLRYFGYCFNPVSFYYCFDASNSKVETIVAEVSNTPWGESHCYVLSPNMNLGDGDLKRFKLSKQFHVSPFMDMDQDYDWRFIDPQQQLTVHMRNNRKEDGRKIFDATLMLHRKEISGSSLALILLRFPFMTGKVIFLIYMQALIMWLKRFTFYDHPKHSQSGGTQSAKSDKHLKTTEAPK